MYIGEAAVKKFNQINSTPVKAIIGFFLSQQAESCELNYDTIITDLTKKLMEINTDSCIQPGNHNYIKLIEKTQESEYRVSLTSNIYYRFDHQNRQFYYQVDKPMLNLQIELVVKNTSEAVSEISLSITAESTDSIISQSFEKIVKQRLVQREMMEKNKYYQKFFHSNNGTRLNRNDKNAQTDLKLAQAPLL